MAIAPGTYDMTVQRRADHVVTVLFEDSEGDPIDLSDYNITAAVWDKSRTTSYGSWNITKSLENVGEIEMRLRSSVTTEFKPNVLKYDLLFTSGPEDDRLKEYYLEGTIYVSEGYT